MKNKNPPVKDINILTAKTKIVTIIRPCSKPNTPPKVLFKVPTILNEKILLSTFAKNLNNTDKTIIKKDRVFYSVLL